MSSSQHPLLQAQRPWWQPAVSLAITLYGILVHGWGMQAIVLLFWWETLLIIGAGLIRAMFALDGKPVLSTLGQKILVLPFGVVMGGAMIMLSVAFSLDGMKFTAGDGSLGNFGTESRLLLASYALGLLLHYFLNRRFRAANPVGEMMAPLLHLLGMLCMIMPITAYLLPNYPDLDTTRYVAVTIAAVKFISDTIFTRLHDHARSFMSV
jgi:hypothetical protein